MRYQQAVFRLGNVQKAGGAAVGGGLVIKLFVHLVRQNPRARATAVRQDLLLLFARQRPARGVVGRIHDQQPRALGDGLEQPRQVQPPGPALRLQWHAAHLRPHDGGLRHQIGPHGGDDHGFIPCIYQRLHGQHECADPARCDDDAVGVHLRRRVRFPGVLRQCLAQLGQAAVLRVKGFATLQRLDGRVANHIGRDLITLTKPEGQHIFAPHAGVGDLADLGCFELGDDWAHATGSFNKQQTRKRTARKSQTLCQPPM